MKIAIIISGLVRFPEQGFVFLENILRKSVHDIDIYAGVWSIDSNNIPDSIRPKLKGISIIPYSLRDELCNMLADNNLNVGNLNDDTFINAHSGLIAHMATCTAFEKELKNYDTVVKWRWDLAVAADQFNRICNESKKMQAGFITDTVRIDKGEVVVGDIALFSSPTNMIAAFAPVKEKFLRLGEIIDYGNKSPKAPVPAGSHYSYAQLLMDAKCDIVKILFNWALIRENILDNLHCLHTGISEMVRLQQQHDRRVNQTINKAKESSHNA